MTNKHNKHESEKETKKSNNENVSDETNKKSEKQDVNLKDKEDNKNQSTENKDPLKELKNENKNLLNENKKLQEENKKCNNELNALKDRIQRMVSEYDNYRKRTAKEKDDLYNKACEDVLIKMLPVLDNLERAIKADGSFEDLKQGIDMTIKQFESSFKDLGVEEISTEEGFDPNFHNAVMHVEDDNYKEKEVVEVFQKGYKRENKVIRYSMVKVAN